ncbi:MAG: glycogen synthase [Elusimicrobiota bacterium]
MKAAIYTNEYPPNVYGGAGVAVEYLANALAKLIDVEVRCFGDQRVDRPRLTVRGFDPWKEISKSANPGFAKALEAVSINLNFCKDNTADVVHCHTWYSMLGGHFAKILHGVPLVITTHSLEPLRPWKREQLGNAYDLSGWIERTAILSADAVIAVSREVKKDILRCYDVPPEKIHVIHNGIDINEYRKNNEKRFLTESGVDPDIPYVLFVGRITRQKGIIHLVNAIPKIDPRVQVVLCAGAPDTAEIAREMAERVRAIRKTRKNVVWIEKMVSKTDAIELYSNAAVFCCPSIYEPFGIINLEAMACETAVVASDVGGIKEVVVPGETGLTVPFRSKTDGTFEPEHPAEFSADLACAINRLLSDPSLRETFGKNGRARVERDFSWDRIAQETVKLYARLIPQ